MCDALTGNGHDPSTLNPTRLIEKMRISVLEVLQQLDKAIRPKPKKKTDSTETLTIMFTLCVITVGTEMRLECLSQARHDLETLQAHCLSVQTKWHDTMIALFSACKDLKVSGDIEESIFEITNWKLEYG